MTTPLDFNSKISRQVNWRMRTEPLRKPAPWAHRENCRKREMLKLYINVGDSLSLFNSSTVSQSGGDMSRQLCLVPSPGTRVSAGPSCNMHVAWPPSHHPLPLAPLAPPGNPSSTPSPGYIPTDILHPGKDAKTNT